MFFEPQPTAKQTQETDGFLLAWLLRLLRTLTTQTTRKTDSIKKEKNPSCCLSLKQLALF